MFVKHQMKIVANRPYFHPTFYGALEGRLVMLPNLRERIFTSGIEPGLRREVWKFLLGLYPPCSTFEERETLMSRLRAEYQVCEEERRVDFDYFYTYRPENVL